LLVKELVKGLANELVKECRLHCPQQMKHMSDIPIVKQPQIAQRMY
jgi:hypothetical protein